MKRLLTLITLCLTMTVGLIAQGSISGVIVDADTNEGLVGATILVKGTNKGAITDIDGSFTLTGLNAGDYTLSVSYVGFETSEMPVSVGSGATDLGQISLSSSAVGLAEVEVISSIAIDRRTPVAVSTLKGDYVESRVGNQEYPEILRKTPSIYVTKQGGGFGDSRINVRGFNQRNVAVMINGIPVNDMENGWVYWSNWAGLADVTSNLQVQRGLGSSKLAVASVGGSINIVTNAADLRQGGTASVSIGNDGYQKYGLSYSTGLSESGWAISAQATHTRGDGYADGTAFRAYSYFLSVTKEISNEHTIAVTALGAPQWHNQRLIAGPFDNITLRTYYDPDNTGDPGTNLGTKFNYHWGMLNGEEFNWRKNFYHKPKAFINHYWNISPTTDLKTSAYVSLGRGGGTGPRGRLRTPGSIFDSFSGLGQGIHDENGMVRFDDIVRYNMGQNVEGWGQKERNAYFGNVYVVSEDGRIYYDENGGIVNDSRDDWDTRDNTGSGFIRRASMNSHNWYGVLSTLSTELSDNLNLVAGLDWRYYKGIHYRRVENLLGADGYSSKSNINNVDNFITTEEAAEFGSFGADGYKNGNNVLNYYNDGLVNWLGLFAQVEHVTDKATVFAAVSGSNQGFKRVDYFNYLDSDPNQETDWENILGGTIKAGANFNLDDNNNVFVNAGFYSKQPIFDNVYINFVNELNENVKNQTVAAFEAGYGYRSRDFSVKTNVYYTNWGNRQFDIFTENAQGEDILYNFEDVDQTHIGL
ncbi:MAG: carboxypeptidase-like regulatory domain-containing protein, partial [Saprospiraceae bacterium]|nr:carboxypeptidase-like regulatory domain-containing protein [Saprospiraceae bacterium]